MHLDITPEVIMTQLGYSRSEQTLKQIEDIIKNTKGFKKFARHILSLNDTLKHMNAYVALSNNNNYFKIKCDNNDSNEIINEFKEQVEHFATKYNVHLEKIVNKEVYYILGVE